VICIPFESYNNRLRIEAARDLQKRLLDSYEYVLYADADEILVPDPKKYGDIKDYIAKTDRDYVYCQGYEIMQLEDEAPIDLDRPILRQRRFWYCEDKKSKPLLARVPLAWRPGFHDAANTVRRVDQDFWCLHLHRMDYGTAWAKHREISRWKWSEENLKNGASYQFRITDEKSFKEYFWPKGFKKERWWFLPVYALVKTALSIFGSARMNTLKTRCFYYFRHDIIKKIPERLLKKEIV
jgi:hypothetical protein